MSPPLVLSAVPLHTFLIDPRMILALRAARRRRVTLLRVTRLVVRRLLGARGTRARRVAALRRAVLLTEARLTAILSLFVDAKVDEVVDVEVCLIVLLRKAGVCVTVLDRHLLWVV